jgi:hypothetical protein
MNKKEKNTEEEPIEEESLATKEEMENLRIWYKEELDRKDKKIEELEKERSLLLESAIKRSRELVEISERVQKLNQERISPPAQRTQKKSTTNRVSQPKII